MTEPADTETIDKMKRSLEAAWESIIALETRLDLLDTNRVTEQAVNQPAAGTIALIAELKAWRKEQWTAMKAEGGKAPAYSVITDKAINSIAVNLPRDRYDLALVHGIGPDKTDKYGADILAIVAKYVATPQAEGDARW